MPSGGKVYKHKKGDTPWITFVKEFARIHNLTWLEAMKKASGPYRRGEGPASKSWKTKTRNQK